LQLLPSWEVEGRRAGGAAPPRACLNFHTAAGRVRDGPAPAVGEGAPLPHGRGSSFFSLAITFAFAENFS